MPALSFLPKPWSRHRALLLSTALVAVLVPGHAQDTTFYSKASGAVSSLRDCDTYIVSLPDTAAPDRLLKIARTRDGRLRWVKRSIAQGTGDPVPDGIERLYFDDGTTLRWEREYARGADVRILTFWEEGQPRRVDHYEKDSLVSGTCFKQDGSPDTWYPFLTQPVFKGGMDSLYSYLTEHLRYPKKARRKWINGKVYVQFTVNTDGTIIDAKVIRSVDPLLDEEALRVVNGMPPWIPGKAEDVPVRCRYNLPVVFTLKY